MVTLNMLKKTNSKMLFWENRERKLKKTSDKILFLRIEKKEKRRLIVKCYSGGIGEQGKTNDKMKTLSMVEQGKAKI